MTARSGWPRAREAVLAALPAWVVARVCVVGGLALARFVFDEVGAGQRPSQLDAGLLGWDAGWYARIAEHGYGALPHEALRFFPLVPMLARVVAVPLAGNTDLALLIVGNVASLAAGALLYRLAIDETQDRDLARRATWLVALAPAATALVMGYAESTAMALAIAAFLALRRRRWGWVAVAGALAGLARPVGVLLAAPIAVEVVLSWRAASWRERRGQLGAVLAPAVGTLVYLVWVGQRHGGWLDPYRISQSELLRGSSTDPFTNLVDAGRDLARGDQFGSGLHLPWALLFIVLLVVAFRRWPARYGVLGLVVLGVGLTADNLDSLERYALGAFPLVLAAASLTRHELAERVALLLSTAGLVAYATLAFLGASIP